MTASPANPDLVREPTREAGELEALRRMLIASRGCFSLSFAVCNSPALRNEIIQTLQNENGDLSTLSVPADTVDVFSVVTEQIGQAAKAAIFIVDLERSIPSAADDQPALRSLNASRELLERRWACPVVFWVPEYAVTLVSRLAPDLWRYRSHVFDFVSEQETPRAAMQDRFSGDLTAASNLSAEEKRFRIAELTQRLAAVDVNADRDLIPHILAWLNELAFLLLAIGDLDEAEKMLRQALEINQKLGRLEGMAAGYGNLGLIYRKRGDLNEAEMMHRKALGIEQQLGRLEGMANQYGNLCLIYQTRGDLAEAEKVLRQALEINKKLGRLKGMATEYGNLGLIYRKRGDLDEAEKMFRQALEIEEKLGRLEGMANQYGNLGVVYGKRGDLDEAEKMLRKALEIDQKLGRLEGMANHYSNLGLICRRRGDLDEADKMHRKALEIDQKLGRLEGMATHYGNLGLVYEQRGDLKNARELWTKALELFTKVGMKPEIEKTKRWLDELPPG